MEEKPNQSNGVRSKQLSISSMYDDAYDEPEEEDDPNAQDRDSEPGTQDSDPEQLSSISGDEPSEGSISDEYDSDTEWDEDKLQKANDRKYWSH